MPRLSDGAGGTLDIAGPATLSTKADLTPNQKIAYMAAKEAFEPEAAMPDLIYNDRLGQGHITKRIPTYKRMGDAVELTEGTDYTTAYQLAETHIDITPAELGILGTVSRLLIQRQGDTEPVSLLGRQLGAGVKRRIDKRLLALFAGISKNGPGIGNSLDVSTFRHAMAYMRTDNTADFGPARGMANAVLHIEQISDLLAVLIERGTAGNIMGATGGNMPDMAVKEFYKGKEQLYSVSIWEDGNISKVDDSGPPPTKNSTGGVFYKDFAAWVQGYEDEVSEQPDHSARVTEYGAWSMMGERERVDQWAVGMTSETSAGI